MTLENEVERRAKQYKANKFNFDKNSIKRRKDRVQGRRESNRTVNVTKFPIGSIWYHDLFPWYGKGVVLSPCKHKGVLIEWENAPAIGKIQWMLPHELAAEPPKMKKYFQRYSALKDWQKLVTFVKKLNCVIILDPNLDPWDIRLGLDDTIYSGEYFYQEYKNAN